MVQLDGTSAPVSAPVSVPVQDPTLPTLVARSSQTTEVSVTVLEISELRWELHAAETVVANVLKSGPVGLPDAYWMKNRLP
jgi:hypothetical protein